MTVLIKINIPIALAMPTQIKLERTLTCWNTPYGLSPDIGKKLKICAIENRLSIIAENNILQTIIFNTVSEI
ncbi:hypothetical protein, partial [Providencia rettgeri]|uniref:hypothetical protein n=1 Tax=Providencia rettgeri TaxID=587 RepID=UPI001AAF30F4